MNISTWNLSNYYAAVLNIIVTVLISAIYARVTISEEARFLTVSMAIFRNNRQALYGIFQYVLTSTTTNPPQNNITITSFFKVF